MTCVDKCRGGLPAQITQNGDQLNILTEAGTSSRAWPDWAFADELGSGLMRLDEGAVYSPDDARSFDNGPIWLQRFAAVSAQVICPGKVICPDQ